MLSRSRMPNGLIFAASLVSLLTRLHHAGAQTCNCSCDAVIPATLDVDQVYMNEGPGPASTYVTAGRGNPCQNTEVRHANQMAFGATTITHFCVYAKSPTGQSGETAYAFLAYLDPANNNLPGTVMHETAFTINGSGHQLVQLQTPVAVTGTLWAGVRYPTARCTIGHQGVNARNQGLSALFIGGPAPAGGWKYYDSTGSGVYVGKAPLIRPLSLIPVGTGGGGGGGGGAPCKIIVGPQTNAAGLLETDEPGSSKFVSVQLSRQPTDFVHVNIASTNPAEGIVSTSSLIFDPVNWNSPQFFTVHGVDDPLPDGSINYRVEFTATSADPCYHMLPVPAVNCVNLDDETGGIVCGGKWTQSVPFGMVPAPLADPAMAFDSYRNVSVMVGGQPGAAGPAETWEWSGSQWKLVSMSGPSNRTGHALAFDSHRNVVVLMGGTDTSGIQLADTWEYDGLTWTQKSAGLPNAPGGPRVDHAMAFDERRGVTVLFGGDPILGVNQAWDWNGTTWTPRPHATTPVRRSNHMMTFDARRQRVLLFSGFLNSPPFVENEIWEYDGSVWTQVATIGPKPPARTDAGFVHDPVRGVSILFGGNAGGMQNDTWEWDGISKTWNLVPTVGPAPMPRMRPAMAYDIPRRVAVVFGGDNGGGFGWVSDTWLYDPAGPISLPTSRHFLVRGFGSGLPYSWGVTIYHRSQFTLSQGGFPFGLPASAISGMLTSQINASGCGQLVANTNIFAPSIMSISTTSPAQYGLSFGSAGSTPACPVQPFTICAFNPTITEVFLDGVDCNNNGIDDVLDIANDELLDANINGVIDSCEVISTGDLNCDNVVNALDVQDFIIALLDPAMYTLLHPECSVMRADINVDGQNDGRDVAPFVMLLAH